MAVKGYNGARVFVTQRPIPNRKGWFPNLQGAEKYGALHFVFEPQDRPFHDTDAALNQAREKLSDFDTKKDFVLWPSSGDPAGVWAVMLALATDSDIDEIQVLYWDRKFIDGERSSTEGYYIPIKFRL